MGIEDMIGRGLDLFHIPAEEAVVEKLSLYIRELSKWNDRINLVGFKNLKPVVELLLYDTFFLYTQLGPGKKLLDLGSGSGIVAIPLKILAPNLDIYSVDKSLKKIQFQRHVARTLILEGFHPLHGRIESIDLLEVDTLVAKAFGPTDLILQLGNPHMKEGGRAYIVKGAKEEPAEAPHFTLEESLPYHLASKERTYQLFIYKKTTH
jgi:16S rRNA (guanine527-N7)-methyltransferase